MRLPPFLAAETGEAARQWHAANIPFGVSSISDLFHLARSPVPLPLLSSAVSTGEAKLRGRRPCSRRVGPRGCTGVSVPFCCVTGCSRECGPDCKQDLMWVSKVYLLLLCPFTFLLHRKSVPACTPTSRASRASLAVARFYWLRFLASLYGCREGSAWAVCGSVWQDASEPRHGEVVLLPGRPDDAVD